MKYAISLKFCQNGFVLRATNDRILASPPLIITRAEIDQLISTLRAGLDHLRDTMPR